MNDLQRFLPANQKDPTGFSFTIDDIKGRTGSFYLYKDNHDLYLIGFPYWEMRNGKIYDSFLIFTNLHEQYKNDTQLHHRLFQTLDGPHCITFDEEGYAEFLFLLEKHNF